MTVTVTIRNAAVPPFVDQFIEGMAARACYSMIDLFVGYDHRTLDISSRDLTSFQTPLCYVTVGTFARRGLSSTAKTLRSLSGVRVSEY